MADDDLDDQILIREGTGWTCPKIGMKFVQDGVELLDCLREAYARRTLPSLVLLDLNMPRKDGRTALREIRADPRLAHVPVVVLTTSNADEDERACRADGANDYFRKPANLAEYLRILESLCSKYF